MATTSTTFPRNVYREEATSGGGIGLVRAETVQESVNVVDPGGCTNSPIVENSNNDDNKHSNNHRRRQETVNNKGVMDYETSGDKLAKLKAEERASLIRSVSKGDSPLKCCNGGPRCSVSRCMRVEATVMTIITTTADLQSGARNKREIIVANRSGEAAAEATATTKNNDDDNNNDDQNNNDEDDNDTTTPVAVMTTRGGFQSSRTLERVERESGDALSHQFHVQGATQERKKPAGDSETRVLGVFSKRYGKDTSWDQFNLKLNDCWGQLNLNLNGCYVKAAFSRDGFLYGVFCCVFWVETFENKFKKEKLKKKFGADLRLFPCWSNLFEGALSRQTVEVAAKNLSFFWDGDVATFATWYIPRVNSALCNHNLDQFCSQELPVFVFNCFKREDTEKATVMRDSISSQNSQEPWHHAASTHGPYQQECQG